MVRDDRIMQLEAENDQLKRIVEQMSAEMTAIKEKGIVPG